MFFRAGKEHKAASRTAAAAGTPDLIVTDYVIPPSGTIPELRRLMKLFLCSCQKSGADRTIIPAHGVDRRRFPKFRKSINIPFQIASHFFLHIATGKREEIKFLRADMDRTEALIPLPQDGIFFHDGDIYDRASYAMRIGKSMLQKKFSHSRFSCIARE